MPHISASDSASIKGSISAFYEIANISPPSMQEEITERTAVVFLKMYEEAVKCSKAMAWVPRPPTGPASVLWLVKQLSGATIRSLKGTLSVTCVKTTIYKWGNELEYALQDA